MALRVGVTPKEGVGALVAGLLGAAAFPPLGLWGLMAVPLIALMAGYFGLFATLFGLTRQRPPLYRAALIDLFAVAVEWLRGDACYLRFPWYTVPHALA